MGRFKGSKRWAVDLFGCGGGDLTRQESIQQIKQQQDDTERDLFAKREKIIAEFDRRIGKAADRYVLNLAYHSPFANEPYSLLQQRPDRNDPPRIRETTSSPQPRLVSSPTVRRAGEKAR